MKDNLISFFRVSQKSHMEKLKIKRCIDFYEAQSEIIGDHVGEDLRKGFGLCGSTSLELLSTYEQI